MTMKLESSTQFSQRQGKISYSSSFDCINLNQISSVIGYSQKKMMVLLHINFIALVVVDEWLPPL